MVAFTQLCCCLPLISDSVFAMFHTSWRGFVLVFSISVLLMLVFNLGLSSVLADIEERHSQEEISILHSIKTPALVTVLFAGLYAAISLIPLGIEIRSLLQTGCLTLVVILWARSGWIIGNHLTSLESERFERDDILPILSNLWKISVIVASLYLLLIIWEVDVTPILASAGIAGVAAGFAAKDTIANFFGGLALYFDNTYSTGDYIRLESGDEGRVHDIGIRSTVLRTRDNVQLTVPNSVLNSERIHNESAPERRRRINVDVGVAYGTEIEHCRDVLIDVSSKCDKVLTSPEAPNPEIRVEDFGDSAIVLRVVCWVERPRHVPRVKSDIRESIYLEFEQEDISIPYPHRTLSSKSSLDIGQEN